MLLVVVDECWEPEIESMTFMSSSEPPTKRAVVQNVTRHTGWALKTALLTEWVYAGHAEVAVLDPAPASLT